MTLTELRDRLDATERKRDALKAELAELTKQLPAIRAAFGNPYSYSRPAEPSEGTANDTGHSSHDVSLPTILEFRRLEGEIAQLKAALEQGG